jgi:hypothetical protein
MLKYPTDIKGLIETQFPDYYREEGRRFVDFVTLYYEWMENKTQRVHHIINPRKEYVQVRHNNNQVIGVGTVFSNVFTRTAYAEDSIAIYKSNNEFDYEVFKISSVVNNTLILLTNDKLPTFSNQRAWHGHVKSQPNPGYYTRRNFDILDIDETFDEFIVYYKEQYLKNIQFNTITDTKTLVKNSLDLYRSKGTPRAVNLLFKIAFGVPAEVFYPQVDIFKTSSGDWYIPTYLELVPSENNVLLKNRQIVGLKSGATAFVQNIVKKTVQNKIVDIAYISAINGTFETGEKINIESEPLEISKAATIVGSLNYIDLDSGGFGSGYAVGDTFKLVSVYGDEGIARVSEIANSTGELAYVLVDGGYGYTNSASVLVSNNIITISNIAGSNVVYFEDFETLVQPLANIAYSSATSANAWVEGDSVFAYDGGGNVVGEGIVLIIEEASNTAGEMFVAVTNGDLNVATIYTTSNVDSASVDTHTDKTVTANVIGAYANVILKVENVSGTFINNEEIVSETSGNGIFGTIFNTVGTNASLNIVNCSSYFEVGKTITGANSGATANVTDIEISIGVVDVSNVIIALDGNYIYGNNLLTSGTVSFVSTGSGADINFSNNLLYTEIVSLNTDYITANGTHYLPIDLAATQWDFPGDPSGNLTSNTIDNILTYANVEIGKIQILTSQNPGDGYNAIPIIKILEPLTYPYRVVDEKIISISNAGSFLEGEIITQDSTDFRGLVVTANDSVILAERLRFYDNNDVIPTTNTETLIVGSTSGSTANVDFVEDYPLVTDVTAINRRFLGYNAEIGIDVVIANGVVSALEVTDSGFGFKNREPIYVKGNNSLLVGYANLQTHGTGKGFYKSEDGFLSNVKKLQDGHYWQTHSYEVRSSIGLNNYREMLKEVVHVAGHIFFGNLVYFSVSNNNVTAVDTIYSNNTFTFTYSDLTENADTLSANSIVYRTGIVTYTEGVDTLSSTGTVV